jgi:hypothetical protein
MQNCKLQFLTDSPTGWVYLFAPAWICFNSSHPTKTFSVPVLFRQSECSFSFLAWVTTPGVDVMITIFCDFRQFFCEKLAFFSKNIVRKFWHNLGQNANFFVYYFGEKN